MNPKYKFNYGVPPIDEKGNPHPEVFFGHEKLGSQVICLECEVGLTKEEISNLTDDDLKIMFFDWLTDRSRDDKIIYKINF